MANTQDFRFGEDEDEKTLDQCRVIEPMTLQFHLKRRRLPKLSGGRVADGGGGGGAGAGDGDGEGGGARVRDRNDRVKVRRLHSGRNSPS